VQKKWRLILRTVSKLPFIIISIITPSKWTDFSIPHRKTLHQISYYNIYVTTINKKWFCSSQDSAVKCFSATTICQTLMRNLLKILCTKISEFVSIQKYERGPFSRHRVAVSHSQAIVWCLQSVTRSRSVSVTRWLVGMLTCKERSKDRKTRLANCTY